MDRSKQPLRMFWRSPSPDSLPVVVEGRAERGGGGDYRTGSNLIDLIISSIVLLLALLTLSACTFGFDPNAPGGVPTASGGSVPAGDDARVTRVIDGDTIDVNLNGQEVRVRYVGVNTPERDEVCYSEAKNANSQLVEGKTVRLVRDVNNTDQYGRLLRYIYVGSTFVNAALVQQGYAEVVSYPPDTAQFEYFKSLEIEATNANRGCHPTGIFDDGSYTR